MEVIEIVKAHLKSVGADGLLAPGECGCKLCDLVPCGSDFSQCVPGFIGPPACEDHDEWTMYPSKARAEAAKAASEGAKP